MPEYVETFIMENTDENTLNYSLFQMTKMNTNCEKQEDPLALLASLWFDTDIETSS